MADIPKIGFVSQAGAGIQSQASSTQAASQAVPVALESGSRVAAIAMYCVLLVAYALMAADRYLFPVLAPDVRRDFGFSLANTGLLSTIFTLGLGIGGLPTGYLLSRFSRKVVMLVGIAIFSASIALTTIAIGFWSMLVCLAVAGIGMAMLATVMFALAASYFFRHRAAAIGSVNFCYGIGGIAGPLLASLLLGTYGTWRAPMIAFGLFGFLMIVVIALAVRSWFSETSSETRRAIQTRADLRGATTLLNWNSMLLTVLSVTYGLVLYGYLGMYPTFLREGLHYSPKTAGFVMSFFGLGALASIAGGWLGDRFPPRFLLITAFLCAAGLGYSFVHGSPAVLVQATLSCVYGVIGSAILYVNLAAFHVKAVKSSLANRGSGMFVTSFYGSSAFAGYLMGALASHAGWARAGEIQITLFSIVAAALSLALRPSEMAL